MGQIRINSSNLPLTPLLVPSILVHREESKVLRRDEAYPDFIRALGGTAQARSAEPSATIRALRIDFGMLDESIDRLEKRLSTRIDSERAWDYFAADTNSAVISRYNRIYIEGSQSSGEPAETADMVSRSVTNLLSLRRREESFCFYNVGCSIWFTDFFSCIFERYNFHCSSTG